jgi:hypothetical protein
LAIKIRYHDILNALDRSIRVVLNRLDERAEFSVDPIAVLAFCHFAHHQSRLISTYSFHRLHGCCVPISSVAIRTLSRLRCDNHRKSEALDAHTKRASCRKTQAIHLRPCDIRA